MLEKIPPCVKIVEVGPRDGLQNEKEIISTDDKFTFISKLVDAGLSTVEVTSFVKKDSIPQMSDAEDLFSKMNLAYSGKNLEFPCLVPNIKGYETAKKSNVNYIAIFSATSDSFTKKNINCTVEESFEKMKEVVALAQADNKKIRGYISTAFGCPYEKDIKESKLLKVCEDFYKLGVDELSIGDTIGVAKPLQVKSFLKQIGSILPLEKLAMHFHDTRGMALTNILVSLEYGVTIFDSSSAGIGGCPYAKGATGNVATEDVVYLLNSMGVKTGIDLKKLSVASEFILQKLNKSPPSKYLTAYLKSGY